MGRGEEGEGGRGRKEGEGGRRREGGRGGLEPPFVKS